MGRIPRKYLVYHDNNRVMHLLCTYNFRIILLIMLCGLYITRARACLRTPSRDAVSTGRKSRAIRLSHMRLDSRIRHRTSVAALQHRRGGEPVSGAPPPASSDPCLARKNERNEAGKLDTFLMLQHL
ncbi:hypothetical protein CPB86DRAFT_784772 [Serendipita vermifera]|nr:hypothetical protein CPB86DRAFT_784772 [Serendipita vermifera]